MTSAAYISQTLTANGGATGILQVASTAALVVGAHVTIVALGIEPQELKIASITNGTTFVVTDLVGGAVNLSAYTTIKNARVTQFAQRDIGASIAGAYVQLTGDTMTGPLSVEGLVESTVGGFKFPDGSIQTVASSGGGPTIPSPVSQNGKTLFSNGVVYVLRNIRSTDITAAFDIISFAASGGLIKEIGQSVATPAFTASYNRTPTSATLTDTEGTAPGNVAGTPTSFSSTGTFSKSANNGSVTFTLTAAEGESDVASISMLWQPRVFWGADLDGLNSEAGIEALPSSALAPSRNKTFTVTALASEHVYYAFPASYGAPTFTVGGFEGGFTLVNATISVTNSFGVNQNYQLWKSVNPNLGAVTVVVT